MIQQNYKSMIRRYYYTYLPRSADAFPKREVADDIDGEQAESHVPFYRA